MRIVVRGNRHDCRGLVERFTSLFGQRVNLGGIDSDTGNNLVHPCDAHGVDGAEKSQYDFWIIGVMAHIFALKTELHAQGPKPLMQIERLYEECDDFFITEIDLAYVGHELFP
jgi:hypothetical protein